MKIQIAVAVGVLFALVPMAAPKTRTPSSSFFASCNSTDTCTVTGSGLAASATYLLIVTDSCNVPVHSTSVNTNSSGVLNTILAGVAESDGCNATGWTFTLSTSGRKAAVVATYFASDPD
jgi:hypothetical protein